MPRYYATTNAKGFLNKFFPWDEKQFLVVHDGGDKLHTKIRDSAAKMAWQHNWDIGTYRLTDRITLIVRRGDK